MKQVCFFLHLDIPKFLNRYSFFEIGYSKPYFDENLTQNYIQNYIDKCLLLVNKKLLETIDRTYGNFKFHLSVPGWALTEMKKSHPEAIESFKALINTGNVEICAETYYESFAAQFDHQEFALQVQEHIKTVEKILKVKPTIFCDTQHYFDIEIADLLSKGGIKSMLASNEVFDSPHRIYANYNLAILSPNQNLSTEISNGLNQNYTINTEFITKQISSLPEGSIANITLNYSDFLINAENENQNSYFLLDFGREILKNPTIFFALSNEVLTNAMPIQIKPSIKSSTNFEEFLNCEPKLPNEMQSDALKKLYFMKYQVIKLGNKNVLKNWKKLQHVSFFKRMDKNVKTLKNFKNISIPCYSFDDEYINFMNIVNDLEIHINLKNKIH